MEKLILIKYGELTTKKLNRNMFINILAKNIKNILRDYKTRIIKDKVRMYIEVENEYLNEIVKKLKSIFGIHGIVVCHKTESNTESIQKKVLEILNNEVFKTFKVNTKRADKTFEHRSMDFNNIMGGFILKSFETKVDVHNPELMLNIEIREEGTFIYTNEIRGAGGYPVGVQGKGLLMLSGGIDSPVAGYLTLKRGVDLECLYFESPPHTSLEAKNKVKELANIINKYSGNITLHVVPFTDIQEAIYKNCPENYMITIMRRMMYRIAEQYSKVIKCKIIVNGESIGQVASQTTTSMAAINAVTNMPIIRPVACLDKLEIIDIAKKIETYETSILPFEDCCTIFLPKHPVINPELEKCIKYEENFDYETLIKECINKIEIINNLKKEEFTDIL